MGAYEVFEAVKELNEIGTLRRPGDDRLARAYFLMGLLRDCGFSSFGVSVLVGERWGDSAVRRFGKGSGVVDVSGRDELLDMVGGFARGGGNLGEIEEYRKAKAELGAVGLDFPGSARLAQNLVKCRSGVAEIDDLSSKLAAGGRFVGEVVERIEVDKDLVGLGLTREIQLRMLGAAKACGSPEELLEAVRVAGGLHSLRREEAELNELIDGMMERVKALSDERNRLGSEVQRRRGMIDAADAALIAGFDVMSLLFVSVEARELGSTSEVINGIRKYTTIAKANGVLGKELEERRGELARIDRELTEKGIQLVGIKVTLDEAKGVYDVNSDVRAVVDLFGNPRGIKMDEVELASLVARVLEEGVKRVNETTVMPSMRGSWIDAVAQMRRCAGLLRQLAG